MELDIIAAALDIAYIVFVLNQSENRPTSWIYLRILCARTICYNCNLGRKENAMLTANFPRESRTLFLSEIKYKYEGFSGCRLCSSPHLSVRGIRILRPFTLHSNAFQLYYVIKHSRQTRLSSTCEIMFNKFKQYYFNRYISRIHFISFILVASFFSYFDDMYISSRKNMKRI